MQDKEINFKIIKSSDQLETYLKTKKDVQCPLTDIAHAYLEISRCTYDLLTRYPKDWTKLKNGYPELLKCIDIIQKIQTETSGNNIKDENDRNAIKNNKDHATRSVELCISLMLSLKKSKREFIFSIVAIFLSISSIFISFGLKLFF